MKIKEPIPLDKIVDYYAHQSSLCRNTNVVLSEFQDLLTITEFLSSKIPFRIKSIRNKLNQSKKNLQNVYGELDKIFREINDPQRQIRLSMNPRLGYDIFCRLSHHGDEDNDYRQQFAEKQMKLKFLSSRFLPNNLKWRELFDSRINKLVISHKNICIFVGLGVIPGNSSYFWDLTRIEQINLKKPLQHLNIFYDKIMRPQNKILHPDDQEDFSLSWMIKFLKFIELIQTKRYLAESLGIQAKLQNILSFTYDNIQYAIAFSKPEIDQFPIFSLTTKKYPNFAFQVNFNDKILTSTIRHDDTIYICQAYNIHNIRHCLQKLPNLFEILSRKQKYTQNFPIFSKVIKSHFLIKWNGFLFKHSQYNSSMKSLGLAQKTRNQSLYICANILNKPICIQISRKGKPFCQKVSQYFLIRCMQKFPERNAEMLFPFLYIIEYFLQDNQSCNVFSLTDYNIVKSQAVNNNYSRTCSPSINPSQSPHNYSHSPHQINSQHLQNLSSQYPAIPEQYKIQMRFKKRILSEEWILRSSFKQHSSDSFNFIIISIRVEFELNFTGVLMRGTIAIRDDPIIIDSAYSLPEYTNMMENKKPLDLLDIHTVLKQIDYLRNHGTILKFHETKLASEIKQKTKLSMKEY